MTTAADLPLCDATAMTRFHRIFREAMSAAPRLVGSAPDDDRERAEHVGSYYADVLKLLHAHHEAEDDMIYPKLVERLPDHHDVITTVNAEHEDVLGALGGAEDAVAAWRARPSPTTRDAAAAALADLGPTLLGHLDHEEEEVVPLIGQCITQAEWLEMNGNAFGRFTGDKVWLVVGLIQEQMLPEENTTMEANMPPAVKEFWVGTGRPMFDAYVAALRAPLG